MAFNPEAYGAIERKKKKEFNPEDYGAKLRSPAPKEDNSFLGKIANIADYAAAPAAGFLTPLARVMENTTRGADWLRQFAQGTPVSQINTSDLRLIPEGQNLANQTIQNITPEQQFLANVGQNTGEMASYFLPGMMDNPIEALDKAKKIKKMSERIGKATLAAAPRIGKAALMGAITNENPEEGAEWSGGIQAGAEALNPLLSPIITKSIQGIGNAAKKYIKPSAAALAEKLKEIPERYIKPYIHIPEKTTPKLEKPQKIEMEEPNIQMEPPIEPKASELIKPPAPPELNMPEEPKEELNHAFQFEKPSLSPVKKRSDILSEVENEVLPEVHNAIREGSAKTRAEGEQIFNDLQQEHGTKRIPELENYTYSPKTHKKNENLVRKVLGISDTQFRNMNSKSKNYLQNVVENPNYGNLHRLKSSLQRQAVSTLDGNIRHDLMSAADSVENKIYDTLKPYPEALNKYAHGIRFWRNQVRPYEESQALRNISGGIADITGTGLSQTQKGLQRAASKTYNPRSKFDENGLLPEGGTVFRQHPLYEHQKYLTNEINKRLAENEANKVANEQTKNAHAKMVASLQEMQAKEARQAAFKEKQQKAMEKYKSDKEKHEQELKEYRYKRSVQEAKNKYQMEKEKYDKHVAAEKERVKEEHARRTQAEIERVNKANERLMQEAERAKAERDKKILEKWNERQKEIESIKRRNEAIVHNKKIQQEINALRNNKEDESLGSYLRHILSTGLISVGGAEMMSHPIIGAALALGGISHSLRSQEGLKQLAKLSKMTPINFHDSTLVKLLQNPNLKEAIKQ